MLFADPCIVVIFGATGDLTARKLMPALYHLLHDGLLPSNFACVGFARRDKQDALFRTEMQDAVARFSRTKRVDPSLWEYFSDHLFYHRGELTDPASYASLQQRLLELDRKLGTVGNRIFYLATPASYFPTICRELKNNGLLDQASARVIIEKPFGHDLASAEALQQQLLAYMREDQLYRIDHYLGKETVQNLLVFRFANALFESVWNHRYIDHLQITIAEDQGIGTRGKFWEETGLLRDLVQNHAMQLLSLVTMEPPASLSAQAIQDEKVKVLRAIRPLEARDVVLGQYGPGLSQGQPVVGYLDEPDVAPRSSVETYTALRLFIDNWRWAGVPIYLRAGKRLPKKVTEVAVVFKAPSHVLFQQTGRQHELNTLAIRIQPEEGIALKVNCKIPGPTNLMQPVAMNFRYGSYFGGSQPEAYERLIYDCMVGDSTLFARDDEVLLSWKLFSPILQGGSSPCAQYTAGSWGPPEADSLLQSDRRHWRLL